MKLLQVISISMLTLSPLIAEEETKSDEMTAEYRSPGPIPTHGITMEGALNALGVTLDKIDYVKLIGNEGAGVGGLTRKVKIDDWFWDTYFQRAEPYKFWESSGNHKLEIYLKGESKAKTTIYINATDSCSVEGDPRKLRYMCYGLNGWIMAHLKPEPEKAEGGADQQAGPGSLRSELAAVAAETKIGEPVFIRLTLHNGTDKPVPFWEYSIWSNCFVVIDPNGNEVPFKRPPLPSSRPFSAASRGIEKLEPKSSVLHLDNFDMARSYPFTKPGIYTISFRGMEGVPTLFVMRDSDRDNGIPERSRSLKKGEDVFGPSLAPSNKIKIVVTK